MLRLRPYKKCDAKCIVSWIKDEESFWKWCAGRYEKYPITAEDMNKYYEAYAEDESFFQMTAIDENGAVGHLIMRFLDEEKSDLRFGFIIVDAEKRGKGYGKEMLKLAMEYAFKILKVKRVSLGVFENNPSAIHCYQSAGLSKTGETAKYQLMGEEWNCLEMERLVD